MTGVDAFEDEVDAYPAVTIIRREAQQDGPLVVEGAAGFGPTEAREVIALASSDKVEPISRPTYQAARLHGWFEGRAGWPSGSPARLAVIAGLEAAFPPLESAETGTKVGIGVATGADKVYIVRDAELVEPERLLPLALPRDSGPTRPSRAWSARWSRRTSRR